MVNQEFLGYIRQQFLQKIPKDTIKTNLMSQGWSEQDIAEGFKIVEIPVAVPAAQATSSAPAAPKSFWTNGIRRINNVFMIISLVLVFGLDLFIVVSAPDLMPFWLIMLGVLAVFAFFYFLENRKLRTIFSSTSSGLDGLIALLIVLRNIVFVLNFIPFIQLLGLSILGGLFSWILGAFNGGNGIPDLGGFGVSTAAVPIFALAYVILLVARYVGTRKSA